MKTLFVIILAAALSGCGGSSKGKSEKNQESDSVEAISTKQAETWYEGEMPIRFNVEENYPETKIRLSDLSEALYIPLETKNDLLLVQRGVCTGNEYFLAGDYIYAHEEQTEILVFKKDGRFVRRINHQGGGPGEYSYISSFSVDTLNKEIFVQDKRLRKGTTLVYDLEGQFKRSFANEAKEIVSLNDSVLVNFSPNSQLYYSIVRKKDGSVVKKLPIRFDTQLPHDSYGRLAYGSLTKSPKGVFLANLGNDTIFEVRNADLKVYPRIIDQSNYPTNFAQVHPTIETARYLMFYILRCHNYKPNVEEHFYIYDKKDKQIYKMTDYTDNSYWVLMDDYPHITNWSKAQNSNVAVRSRLADSLFEAEGKHGDNELKKLIETLEEDANPVLQVMIFHSVDQVKK